MSKDISFCILESKDRSSRFLEVENWLNATGNSKFKSVVYTVLEYSAENPPKLSDMVFEKK